MGAAPRPAGRRSRARLYDTSRVISGDLELTRARLQLNAAAKIDLANTLRLIGVSAPEQM